MEATAVEPPVIRGQDRLMPLANVVRVMRQGLPPHAKVTEEAKQLIQECVSEFISFVTDEGNERCRGEHRKTVTAEDIMRSTSASPTTSCRSRPSSSAGKGRCEFSTIPYRVIYQVVSIQESWDPT
jgi:histone H3/H4